MLQTMASFGMTFMMVASDDVAVAGGRDEDVAARRGFVHRRDFEALHRGLQGVDRIDFGDEHAGPQRLHGVGTALADVAVSGHDHDLAGHHDVGGPLDAVGQRFAAAVEVVELALGDRVVDVDGRDLEFAVGEHLDTADARQWSFLPTGRECPPAAPETSGVP